MNTIAWNCFATVMNMHIKRFLRPAALMFIIGAGAYAASSFPYSPSVAREVQASETDKLIQEGLALLRAGKFDEALANSAKAASLSRLRLWRPAQLKERIRLVRDCHPAGTETERNLSQQSSGGLFTERQRRCLAGLQEGNRN